MPLSDPLARVRVTSFPQTQSSRRRLLELEGVIGQELRVRSSRLDDYPGVVRLLAEAQEGKRDMAEPERNERG